MAGYSFRIRLLRVALFATSLFIAYNALTYAPAHLLPPNEADALGKFPEKPREASADREGNSDGRQPGAGNDRPGPRPENHPASSDQPGARCNVTVTILVPFKRLFGPWREYRTLVDEFSRRATRPGGADGPRNLHMRCPRRRCDVDLRVSTEAEHLNASDAIIMNMFPNALKRNLLKFLSHLRQILNPKIHWFFYGVESPQMMTYWDPNIARIQYHHSMTYGSEADIRLPYGAYSPHRRADSDRRPHHAATLRDWSANKTALVAWMASNCNNTFWPRYEFASELRKHVPVDAYGDCGTLTCLPAMSERCAKLVARYKFYLSLENAECDEYITEKVWLNALLQGAVPVVYGGRKAAYRRILPPNSFIHVGDFASAEQLASYLQVLDRNETMYNAYHAWRAHGSVRALYPPLDPQLFCEVVPFVSTAPPAFRTVQDSGYFTGCRSRTGKFTVRGSLKTFVPWV